MARFPWRDPVTGDVYELPYVPSSRAELDDMVQRMRAQKEMDVADVGTQARQGVEEKIRSGAGQISRDLGLPEIAKEVGGDIDWLANAPVLKPIADAIRAPGGREMARATMPGFEGLEAITGLISGGGALAGAYYDPIKERLASEEKAPLPDIPGIDEIIGNEALEGAPAALEMVAPIDLISAGATGAAAGAARAPLRALRAAAPALSRTATAADIFEALVGGGQVAKGAAEGNIPEAVMGGVRMAGGAAAALPGHVAQADVGATLRGKLEDVAPFLETTARDMGYTDLPVPVSRMAPEDKFFKPDEVSDLVEGIGKPDKPAPQPSDLAEAKAYLDSYRKLSEGKTPTEILTDEKTGHKIELFGDPESPETSTFIVRNPDGSIAAGLGAQSGGLMTWGKNFDAPLEGATGAVRRAAEGKGVRSIGVLTPMGEAAAARFKAKTGAPPERQFGEPPKGPDEEGRYDVDDLPSDEEDFITGIGARRPKETGPDVSTTEGPISEESPSKADKTWGKPQGPEAAQRILENDPNIQKHYDLLEKTSGQLKQEWEYTRKARDNHDLTQEERLDAAERMYAIERIQAARHHESVIDVTPEEPAPLRLVEKSDSPDAVGQAPNAVQPRSMGEGSIETPTEGGVPVQAGVQGVQKGVQPPPLPEGAAPAKASVGEPPLGEKPLSQILDEALSESEAKVPPKLPEGAAPLKSSNREVPPLTKRGQSFADYMTEKFGDRPTSSKERAIARAEWNKIRDERKILRLAEKAGIPPDKLKETLRGAPKEGGPETGRLSAWARFAYPVIENFETVHPWLKNTFTKYVKEAETPAMKNIAEAYRIKKTLNAAEQRHVVDILDGKKGLDADTPANVRQAAIAYRHMLDQTWSDAVASGTRRSKDRKRSSYFPHKFAEGWDDNLVQNIFLDKNWNLRESSLEKARLSKRADYRRDLDVLDEYFLSAYRRIAEVQNFGKRLEVLRRFAKKHVTDKATAEWLQTNIRRIMGREHLGGFERFAGHARHIQALSDLGFAAFYQPIQAINTTLYGGLGRSMRAIKAIVKNSPDEVYDAIRSRSLVPDITQELVAGAYGAREGIPSRALQKFMWGIPTIDKWTRIHANTVGKMMVGDALKGKGKAIDDIRSLGFDDVKTMADLRKKVDTEPDFALEVGRALSDKALFRSGAMELPGWSSSTSGKLATQYMRFMYRHSLFVRDIFTAATKGDVRPLARFLTVAPVAITGMAEVLYPIREALREGLRQTVQDDEFDTEKVFSAAVGDELNFDDEIKWRDVLRNKRIPWDHPLKRLLQNISMWGGIGVFQVALERMMGASGSPVEVGSKLTGAVPSNILEGAGSVIRDLNTLPEDVEWETPPFKQTRRWGAEQVPLVGHSIARRMRDELGE